MKKNLNFERDWGHLSKTEQTIIKGLTILNKFALYGLLFACGAFYGFVRCMMGAYGS